MGEYEDNLGRPAREKRTFGYGQVQFHTYVTLWDCTNLRMTRDMTEVLAIVSLCRTNGEDAT